MATVTGTAQALSGSLHEAVTLQVALRGYGSQIPRVNGDALFGMIEETIPIPAGQNSFTFTVSGNDAIMPHGTYYTVAMIDENGDTLQINAYRFIGDNDYDLNEIDPYDPDIPPPPLPPLIYNELLIVPSQPAPNFPGDQYTAWKITVDQDILGAFMSVLIPGNLYTFIIVQDAVGGHDFEFPTGPPPYGIRNPTPVCRVANSTTVQTFVCDDDGILWAIGPGTWSL